MADPAVTDCAVSTSKPRFSIALARRRRNGSSSSTRSRLLSSPRSSAVISLTWFPPVRSVDAQYDWRFFQHQRAISLRSGHFQKAGCSFCNIFGRQIAAEELYKAFIGKHEVAECRMIHEVIFVVRGLFAVICAIRLAGRAHLLFGSGQADHVLMQVCCEIADHLWRVTFRIHRNE